MKSDLIRLTPKELLVGGHAGLMRRVENIRNGKKTDRPGKHLWQEMVEGALAEMAFAKWMRVHWTAVGSKSENDVGGEDVRCTQLDNGCLILHNWDSDDRNYWLLTGEEGKYCVRGYIRGIDGKKTGYWRKGKEGRPCYYVPQEDLLFRWPEHMVNEQTQVPQLQHILETESDDAALRNVVQLYLPRGSSAEGSEEDQGPTTIEHQKG